MFKGEKNLAVNHGKQVYGKRKPDGKARVTWLLDARDSREMRKKLNFKVSIGVIFRLRFHKARRSKKS